MLTIQPPPDWNRRQKITFWASMACSIPMYFAVTRLAPPQAPGHDSALFGVFVLMACAFAGASFPIENALRARASRLGQAGLNRTGLILALVFCEAAALCGLAVWYSTGSPQYVWLMLIGFGATLLHFPRREE